MFADWYACALDHYSTCTSSRKRFEHAQYSSVKPRRAATFKKKKQQQTCGRSIDRSTAVNGKSVQTDNSVLYAVGF